MSRQAVLVGQLQRCSRDIAGLIRRVIETKPSRGEPLAAHEVLVTLAAA